MEWTAFPLKYIFYTTFGRENSGLKCGFQCYIFIIMKQNVESGWFQCLIDGPLNGKFAIKAYCNKWDMFFFYLNATNTCP